MHGSRSVLLLAALLAPIAAPAQQKRVRIAVLEIRPLATEAAKAELLSEVALTEAASMPGFDVIGKSDINSLIGFEKQKQVMGCSDDSACLAEVGGALGVDFIMVGSLGKIGSMYRIDLKLVETRKARVRGRIGVSVEGQEEKLVAAIQKTVRDLLRPLSQRPDAIAGEEPAKAPAKETREAHRQPAKERSTADARLEARPESSRDAADARASIAEVPGGGDVGVSRSAGAGSRRTWAYVSGGAGLALAIGGAVAGLSAKSAFDQEKSAAAAGDLKAYEDSKAKAKSMALVADGLYATGVAGLLVGTWFWFSSSTPPLVAFEVSPVPGGAVASVSGGF